MSVAATGKAIDGHLDLIPASMSSRKMEIKIQSITAEEIGAIAQSIIASAMSGLLIDITYGEIPGVINKSTDGTEFPGYGDLYDPQSPMMVHLLPKVVHLLAGAFSTPSTFRSEGVLFQFLTTDGWEGLLEGSDCDESLRAKITRSKEQITHNFDLRSMSYAKLFRLNQERTQKSGELEFDLFTKINGAQIGHSGGNIKSYQKDLITRYCF